MASQYPAAAPAPAKKGTAKSPLNSILGQVLDKQHQEFTQRCVEKIVFLGQQLQDYWNNSQRWTKLYMAQRDEFRKLPEEAWRAKVVVPDAYSGVEAKTAILTDILGGPDPLIQAEGIHDEDYEPAKKMERLQTYALIHNRFRARVLPGLVRMALIRGTSAYKTTWLEDIYDVTMLVSPYDQSEFQKKLGDAMDAMQISSPDQVPDHINDPQGFNDWRTQGNVALQGSGTVIPEIPSGKKQVIRYRGPKIEELSLYDLFYDPLIDDIQDQPFVAQRILKPEWWVQQKVKSGAWDAAAVDACLKSSGGNEKVSSQDQTLNDLLGVKLSQNLDPTLGKPLVEIFEVWQLNDPKAPYTVMLNRKGIVNKDPGTLPFQHSQIPMGLIQNVRIPGRAIGISDLQINESLFDEQNTLRELRLDRTKLETLPAFTYQPGIGMPELKRKIAPGMLLNMRPNSIAPLFQYAATNAFEDLRLTKENIADANATYDSTKGAPATINRVSATDSSGRANLALTRHKLQALGIEDGLQQYATQSVSLWLQKATPDLRVRLTGAPDVAVGVSQDDLFEAVNMNFRFRGATQAINRDQLAQKLMQIMQQANPVLTPPELRACLKVLVDQMAIPQASAIVSPEGDAFFQHVFEMTQMAQKAQAQQMQQQQVAANAPVPTQVDPATAASLVSPPSGPGQPPPPPGNSAPPPGMPPPGAPPAGLPA